MCITSENIFETEIVASFINQDYYTIGNVPDYSPGLGLFKCEILNLLQNILI